MGLVVPITVKVLYFGIIRECCEDTREEYLEVPDGTNVEDVVTVLADRYRDLERYRGTVQMAVNESLVPRTRALGDGDTVAFIPQVAGGAEPYCRLTEDPLSVDEVLAAVSTPGQGGVVLFVGIVRDHNQGHDVTRLYYEAYPAMVHRTFGSIVERCRAGAEDVHVAIAHRTGELAIGDIACIVAASAPHRGEAFEAARTCIELLKQETPIWKKEFSLDGAEWIGTRP
ncbi:molybdenum cofactor biosynthesis protein MoaE [Rhodococcus cerastii]|nr:molybdenum cofactor biosynthesis protein MoaE [Rhodococcus cerastii]